MKIIKDTILNDQKGMIVLEDGTVYQGRSFGYMGEQVGELVFNTGMTGYQEILTDPSYKGQIVVMTYPLIGNYGINSLDRESLNPQVSGFVVKENSPLASNWRSENSLSAYLKEHKIIAIEGVDTRAITKHLRKKGAMKAILSTKTESIASLLAKVKAAPNIIGLDLVKTVTCQKNYCFQEGLEEDKKFFNNWYNYHSFPQGEHHLQNEYKIIAIDFGVKRNILRSLRSMGCQVTVVPAHMPAEEILSQKPHGVFLSNGPGDPSAVPYAVETVKKLLSKLPIFGICFGHQIVGLALGGKTFKLKFGHRGCNHPVKNLLTGQVEITSQNHGFCVDPDSFDVQDIEVTHINLNDQTLEGLRHKRWPLFSLQYHPEASPGPHDSHNLFRQFLEMIKQYYKD